MDCRNKIVLSFDNTQVTCHFKITTTLTLQEYIDSLPSDKQFDIAVRLTKLALPIWENYANENELTYRDTVVGLTHLVDKNLLVKTVNTVEQHLHLKKSSQALSDLRKKLDDPIVALQDTDWELPDEVQKTFYSIFNLLETCLGKMQTTFGESTIYVSINQAVDALETSKQLTFDEIKKILYDEKNGR